MIAWHASHMASQWLSNGFPQVQMLPALRVPSLSKKAAPPAIGHH